MRLDGFRPAILSDDGAAFIASVLAAAEIQDRAKARPVVADDRPPVVRPACQNPADCAALDHKHCRRCSALANLDKALAVRPRGAA